MRKILLSILLLLLTLPMLARNYDIAVENKDGVTIYYNYINNGTELQVTKKEYNYKSYTGIVNIPEEVTYMARTLKVTSVGPSAFEGCSGLTSVTIGNSVTSIGDAAFDGCSSLTSLTIPNSMTSIGEGVFYHCSSLTSIVVENGNTIYDSRNNCNAIIETNTNTLIVGCKNTVIPNSVTSIGGSSAFMGCTGLTSVTIPNSVTSIGGYAFSGCSGLTSVTIPNSVTSIGSGAFYDCRGLTSVISLIENPFAIYGKSSNSRTFDLDIFNNITLYVPKGTIDKYKATEGWQDFLFIEEGDGSGGGSEQPEVKKCATPTISYADKKLSFSCETKGVEFLSEIKDVDIKKFYDASIDLSAIYEISVYATKSGYENSDVATATLVWTEAIFTETTPSSDTPTSAKAIRESFPALISANSGNIIVKSEANGQSVAVYSVDGQLLGNATVCNGQAKVPTTLQNRDVAVVKIGNRAVKIMIR